MRHLLFALALLGTAPAAALAQNPFPGAPSGRPGMQAPGVVRGTIVDNANGTPIANVSVGVWSAADSAIVSGAMTRADGAFVIQGLRPGRYYAHVSALGYGPRTISPITITAQSPTANLGAVKLTKAALQVQGLEVTGEKRDVVLAPDHNSYTTRDMPAVSGGNAADVLRNVPSVNVDQDGNVSLRGNQNVVIQINGRPTPMSGEALAAFLQQLPANMVDKVDVIPNPSAKYDPEGMGGIINIELKQNTELGWSAGVLGNASTNGRYNASANVGYQRGKITFYGDYGYSSDERNSSGSVYQENHNLGAVEEGLVPFITQQANSGDGTRHSNNVTASLDYKLNKQNVLSTQFLFGASTGGDNSLNAYHEMSEQLDTTGLFNRLTNGDRNFGNLSTGLTFKHTVQQLQNEYTAQLRYDQNNFDNNSLYTQQWLSLAGSPDSASLETNASTNHTRNYTAQFDLTHPLGGSAKLETGYKGTLRKLDNSLFAQLYDDEAAAYVPETKKNNEFRYTENVQAVYGVLTGQMGEFELQGGLRLESARTNFDLLTTDSAYKNTYTSLYPSALVAYNPTSTRQFKISYSKRVNRPNTWQLNPFTDYEDPMNLRHGNPALKPEYTHSFELGWQESLPKGTLQFTPYFRHTVNEVRWVRTTDSTGVSTTTFENFAKANSYGADFTGSLRLKSVTGFASLEAFQLVTNGSNVSSDLSTNAFGWGARINANWIVSPNLALQAFWMYRAPMKTEQGRQFGRNFLNLGLRQKLSDRAAVTLRVMDPFNTMSWGSISTSDGFYQESHRSFDARAVYLGFTYNVGQRPRIRSERGQGDQGQQGPDQPDQGPGDQGPGGPGPGGLGQ